MYPIVISVSIISYDLQTKAYPNTKSFLSDFIMNSSLL